MKKSKPPLLRAAHISCLAVLVTLGVIVANNDGASKSEVKVEKDGSLVRVTWPISAQEKGSVVFSMDETKPLIETMSVGEKVIASGLTPSTVLTVGSRNLNDQAGWVAFFDNPPKREYQRHAVKLGKRSLNVTEKGAHTTVTVAAASAGNFHGEVRFTFYRNSGLMQAETVLETEEDGRAIIYDTGLTSAKPDWKATVWKDTTGNIQSVPLDPSAPATPLAVAGRTIVAEGAAGSLAVFPAPHRYFYPLDEAFNLKFVWHGNDYAKLLDGYGIGIRQELGGDNRFVPWFNAPPRTKQQLGVFYYLTSGDGKAALDSVAKYTRGDHYKPVDGYKTFSSHYHVEHTLEYIRKQKEQNTTGVPKGLEVPGMVKTFKARGVNIVHLAELHIGDTPRMKPEERLPLLKVMHEECDRLSDDQLLMLPGEEPNVHLGGHWISLFPKPIYWVLNRPAEKPFIEEVPGYGKVYHVGNPEEVLKLMELEKGLMWTAHARIKASIGYPDRYKKSDFYKSEHFLGAAWKAMPADLSRPTLGWRVLDLLDDSSNWGMRKQAIGESDLFRMEPDFETYAHMNINYVKLGTLPKFKEGWQPLLDSLRGGQFFTTTGEILIPEFSVAGKSSGEEITDDSGEKMLEADVEWTFPMSFANVVSGDGRQIFRQRIDLSDTDGFGSKKLRIPLDLKGRTWVRFEAWDIAGNGAFTQPVWIGPKPAGDFAEEARSLPVPKEQLTAGYDEVVPTAAKQPAIWKWTKADPGDDWVSPDFDDSAWAEGRSAFGTPTTPGTDGILNTIWDTKDIWIRRKIKLPDDLGAKLRLLVHHDNKAEVYINGILAWSAANIETRDYEVFEITPEAAAKLKPGATITLSAHGHNGVGGQVLDVGIVTLK
ncbi:hypothetical protein JIN84_05450 [Luteolibacter yonseiensis]|uniref:Glycosyl hydrolases family 2 sugar binding domain-containing protein n=1 Tax=Luteolibacter yonseiensis TaxID=1144680 RepID=A0A934R4D2_9BACT|nr:hypothetical protein [Luteolibacter yonseiensis]MBK1815050.1 hypothetical protein [Luteolibacter yonseiensis]